MINNAEWATLSRALFTDEKGVSYQTVRRMENGGALPRASTLRRLEATLQAEEERRKEAVLTAPAPLKKEAAKPPHALLRLLEVLPDAGRNETEALQIYAKLLDDADLEEVRTKVIGQELRSPVAYALARLRAKTMREEQL